MWQTSAGCWSDPLGLADFYRGLLSLSPALLLSQFCLILLRTKPSLPCLGLNALHFAPPMPFSVMCQPLILVKEPRTPKLMFPF